MLAGLQQLRDQPAPALLQQLPLQGHLGVLTDTLLVGRVQDRVQACLRDQLLVGQRRPKRSRTKLRLGYDGGINSYLLTDHVIQHGDDSGSQNSTPMSAEQL